jgi:allantoate deiminase
MSAPCAARILRHCDALAACSEAPGALTRTFLSAEQRAANARVSAWMQEAGMQVRLDAIGNLVARYEADAPARPALILGSHLDTVRDAGRYDGMLGVLTAIECVRSLHARGRRLPFALEVVGFGDEEGVRFGATLLGSRALAGTFERACLELRDAAGTTLREALLAFGLDPERIGEAARAPGTALAYVELHIEQGPVLEAEGLPLGVVTAINGFNRLALTLAGRAGHAGTVPMALRRDALAGAAQCVSAIERIGRATPELVATVGRIEALPGAINVIPGEARFTLDVRAPSDAVRERAVAEALAEARAIAQQRGLELRLERLQDQAAARCAPWLIAQLEDALRAEGLTARALASGAGHDGMAMRAIADIGMLFVRCKGGVSHHPDESITAEDCAAGARVLMRFIESFRPGRG